MSQKLTPDRLSALPDDILHCIMLFLSSKDTANMASLSRRFRSAWSVFPVIDIDKSILTNDLLAVVELSLQRLRVRNMFGLTKFRLNFEFIKMEQHGPIRELMDSAMENNVEELDVNFGKLFNKLRIFYRLPSSVKYIKVLKLSRIQLNPNVPKLIISYPSLEVLRFSDCLGPKELVLLCENLKTLQLEEYYALQMDIAAPNLEFFSLKQELPRCVDQWIDMSYSKSIRTLILETPGVSEEWLAIHLSNFSLLEVLSLKNCYSLINILVSIPSLKSFSLDNCKSVKNIKIIADRLNSFVCKGNNLSICEIDIEAKCLRNLEIEIPNRKPMPLFVVHSTSTYYEVKLILKLHMQVSEVGFWFKALREFLVPFGHCKVLTLVCNNAKVLSFPEELRDDMLPPLLDLKHVQVEIFPHLVPPSDGKMYTKLEAESPFDEEKLVDSLLWCCPHVESIAIKKKGLQEEKILQFSYAGAHGRDVLHILPVNCWKQCLKEVKMEYFNDTEFRIMAQFFKRSATGLETICNGQRSYSYRRL